jgi:mannose-1-phosphate guanylyltransferase
MDAIVLVGGEGTRLRPLTYDCPKPMLPVVDRSLVAHVVGWLGRHGASRAVLSLGYRPDAFVDAFPSGEIDGVELVYAVEPALLGTAGAIGFAAASAGVSERFLALNGDVLTDLDLSALWAFHEDRQAEATLFLTAVDDPSAFGVVPTAPDGRVLDFVEKPAPGTAPTNLINGGVYVLEPSILRRIPGGRPVSIERETFPALVAEGRLYAAAFETYWLDAGTAAKYLDAQLDILRHRRGQASLPAAPEVSPGIFVTAEAVVAGEVAGVVYAGPGCAVEPGASVTDSVLGPGVRVAAGAVVAGSAILAGAEVGPGASVSESIVGPDAQLGSRCTLSLTVVRGKAQVPAGAELVNQRYPGQ